MTSPALPTIAIALLILGITALGASGAHAAKVYRWVDSEGVTHYGATPPVNAGAESIRLSTGTPEPAEPSDNGNGQAPPAAAAPVDKPAEAPQAEKKTRTADPEQCRKAKQQLEDLENRVRARTKDPETGEYRVMSYEELEDWREKTREAVREHCP